MIELVVAMAVIAAIFVVALQGIFYLQLRSRDTQRVNKAREIVDLVSKYRISHLSYPDLRTSAALTETGIYFIDPTKVFIVVDPNKYKATGNSDLEVKLNDFLVSGSSTNKSQTRYYYSAARGGFMFCVKQESGKTFNLGTIPCNVTL